MEMTTKCGKTCRRSAAFFAVLALLCLLLSACAVREKPESGGVFLWPEKNQEIGYDFSFQENASGTTFAIVHFVYCRELTDDKYYVNQKAVFNRLAELVSPKNAPVDREQGFVTDGVHSYPIIRFFIDTDTQTCRGLALINGDLDRSRARFIVGFMENPTVRVGAVELEYVFFKTENIDEWGCSAAIHFSEVDIQEDILAYTAQADTVILTETETGARFRLMLESGETRTAVLPAWVTPVYTEGKPILNGLDLRIPKNALPGDGEPALALEVLK